MLKETLKPLKGRKLAVLSPSRTVTGRRMRMNCFGASCSSMPADWMRKTKGPALPSMMGTSAALSSTQALSMPSPAMADSRCSTVEIGRASCREGVEGEEGGCERDEQEEDAGGE